MKKLNEFLFSLISPVILGEGVSSETAAVDEQTLRAVYALAKKHDIGHLLARGVQNAECEMKNVECGISAELMAELERVELTAVWRVRNIENEQGRVKKCLEEAEIPFIMLKGAVVRDYYPEAWMRTSSDIDVLVPRGELSHAVCAIEDGLGYRISTVEPHDASMYAKSGVHLDIHTLFEGDTADCRLLDEAWDMCANAQMQNAKCKMQNGRTVGDAGPYGDTGCANAQMQNAECEITLSVGTADSSPEGRAPYASHSGRGGTEGDGEGVVCTNAQMQNAECTMQNGRTVGDAGPYRDTGCANAQMQNAECGMQNVGYERFLTPEHFYFYHVAHMAEHVRNGGCGIRPFIDLYLIRRKTECDRARLDAMLSEYGLDRFEAMAVRLSDKWMECAKAQMQNAECTMQNDPLSRQSRQLSQGASQIKPLTLGEVAPKVTERVSVGAIHESPDSITTQTVTNAKECCTLAPSTAGGPPPSWREAQDESPDNDADAKHNARSVEITTDQLSAFEEYVLTGGVYGSSDQYVAAKQRGGNHGKVRYVLGRIFMPYEQLKKRHPVLEKHRYLTPFFEVYRWCGLLVPARLRRSHKELISAMRVDRSRITSVESLLESLGL